MIREDLEILINNLPEYPGIQGREKYFNSAVLVPFVFINNEYHLLLQKRASSISQGVRFVLLAENMIQTLIDLLKIQQLEKLSKSLALKVKT